MDWSAQDSDSDTPGPAGPAAAAPVAPKKPAASAQAEVAPVRQRVEAVNSCFFKSALKGVKAEEILRKFRLQYEAQIKWDCYGLAAFSIVSIVKSACKTMK